MTENNVAHPPETIEGWYALHQIFRARVARGRAMPDIPAIRHNTHPDGWTGYVDLIGSGADAMLVHFYPTLERIKEAQAEAERILPGAELVYSFLSVTEAGLYHLTARLAADAAKRGGSVGDDAYRAALAEQVKGEIESEHIQRRLYPQPPKEMPYVCFYPMNKRRDADQNWYTLSLDERSRLMQSHGMTGRRYAGKVQQVITGAIGLDAWEWGVTLFAKDPIDFKKLVTDMRFDEVSAKYAEFGDFYVGKLVAVL